MLMIARQADDDLVLLQPTEERHLDPFSAVFAFSALLASSYMQGLLGSLRQEAESLGDRTAQRIKTALVRIFGGEAESSAAQLQYLSAEVAVAMADDPASAIRAADAARMQLVDALVETGLPADRALRLAAAVQRETLAAASGDGA
jgi:hypothetical protein